MKCDVSKLQEIEPEKNLNRASVCCYGRIRSSLAMTRSMTSVAKTKSEEDKTNSFTGVESLATCGIETPPPRSSPISYPATLYRTRWDYAWLGGLTSHRLGMKSCAAHCTKGLRGSLAESEGCAMCHTHCRCLRDQTT